MKITVIDANNELAAHMEIPSVGWSARRVVVDAQEFIPAPEPVSSDDPHWSKVPGCECDNCLASEPTCMQCAEGICSIHGLTPDPDAPPAEWSDPQWVADNLRVGDVFESASFGDAVVLCRSGDHAWFREGNEHFSRQVKRDLMSPNLRLISRAEALTFEERLRLGCKVRNKESGKVYPLSALYMPNDKPNCFKWFRPRDCRAVLGSSFDQWEIVE